jgi:hypothetical protein
MTDTLWSEDTPAPEMKIAGDWQVEVTVPPSKDGATKELRTTLTVPPPEATTVADERYASLPVYNASAPGWTRGERLSGVRAFECTAKSALDPQSVKVRSAATADAAVLERGKDYEIDLDWGTLGRLPTGRIAEKAARLHQLPLRETATGFGGTNEAR